MLFLPADEAPSLLLSTVSACKRGVQSCSHTELWYSYPYPCPTKFNKLPAVLCCCTGLFYKPSWAWAWVWMSQLTHTHQLHTCICISMPPSQSAFQSSCTCFVAILSTIYVETKHNTSMSIRLHMWLFCFVSSELLKGRLLELLLEHPIRSVYLPKHPCLLARTSRSLGPV